MAEHWRGDPQLQSNLVAITEIEPVQALLWDDELVRNEMRHLLDKGQQVPVFIDGEGTVRAGALTLLAAQRLGWSQISIAGYDKRGVAHVPGAWLILKYTGEQKGTVFRAIRAVQEQESNHNLTPETCVEMALADWLAGK
jgi:hypothetical protein